MQRRKFEIAVRRRPQGFTDPVVLEDPSNGFQSNVAVLLEPIRRVHLQALTYPDRVVLVLGRVDTSPEDLLQAFKHLVEGTSASRLYHMSKVALDREWLVIRFYDDSCTFCVAELIGSDENIDQILGILRHLEVPRITEDEVVAFLREGRAP